jgi:hypothetical protein
MTTHEVLVRARNLIGRPEDWSPRMWGDHGRRCAVHALQDTLLGRETDPDAKKIVHPTEAFKVLCDAAGIEPGADGERYFGSWNDTHTHAEVLAAFDKAIAATAPEPDLSFLADVKVEPERTA